MAGGTVAGLFVVGCRQEQEAVQPATSEEEATVEKSEVMATTETEPRSGIEYGFNTHMSANPTEGENLTLETFKQDVDQMAQMGMKAIRFNVWEWELGHLDSYDQAIAYAKEKGLTIHLVTNVPGLSENGQDLAGDLEKTNVYYTRLATRWQGQVDVWQIFNEPDDHTYWNYQRIPNAPEGKSPYPPGYLKNFGEIVTEANQAIKAIDQQTKTTVNVSMWVGSDPWIGAGKPRPEEVLLFNAVAEHIDLISLDPYLDINTEAIKRFPEVIEYFHRVYKKPVVVAELGLPTGDGRFSQKDQGRFIGMAIEAMQKGRVKPEAILLYEIRDEAMRAGAEASFGFTDVDGKPKEGLERVLEVIGVDRADE